MNVKFSSHWCIKKSTIHMCNRTWFYESKCLSFIACNFVVKFTSNSFSLVTRQGENTVLLFLTLLLCDHSMSSPVVLNDR